MILFAGISLMVTGDAHSKPGDGKGSKANVHIFYKEVLAK
jgi:hypothetical protein